MANLEKNILREGVLFTTNFFDLLTLPTVKVPFFAPN